MNDLKCEKFNQTDVPTLEMTLNESTKNISYFFFINKPKTVHWH